MMIQEKVDTKDTNNNKKEQSRKRKIETTPEKENKDVSQSSGDSKRNKKKKLDVPLNESIVQVDLPIGLHESGMVPFHYYYCLLFGFCSE
jgi:hypothetical protein